VVKYLFKDAEARIDHSGDLPRMVADFDRLGIERAVVTVPDEDLPALAEALEPWSDRFLLAVGIDVHQGMRAVRRLKQLAGEYPQITSCVVTPHFTYPAIPPSDKAYWPVYAASEELGLPVTVYVGFPGPRVPSAVQHPMHLDEVCWSFPDLTVIMKHGGEPWVDDCIKLLLKWPNLYYATSGFLPKHYPKQIIDYANTRGADKVLYAGYFPLLSLEDIIEQLASLPLRDHVRPKFLRENALRVLRLAEVPA
jgi:predicted TIM-barrel fold metal-dependent hydrolase